MYTQIVKVPKITVDDAAKIRASFPAMDFVSIPVIDSMAKARDSAIDDTTDGLRSMECVAGVISEDFDEFENCFIFELKIMD